MTTTMPREIHGVVVTGAGTVTPNVAVTARLDVVLSNACGLGGRNASAIFRRYQP